MKLVRENARKQVQLWTYNQHTLTLSNLLCYYAHELRKSDRPILVRAAESKAGLKNEDIFGPMMTGMVGGSSRPQGPAEPF